MHRNNEEITICHFGPAGNRYLVTLLIVINVLTRELLAGETKSSFVQLVGYPGARGFSS